MPDRKKLIYVYGLGRSGSTLLGQVLGQSPNARCVGEFLRFACSDDLSRSFDKHATDVRSLPCSCGKTGSECKENALTKYLEINELHKVHRYFSLSGIRPLPANVARQFFGSVTSTLDYYDAEVIIDTSKNPRILLQMGRSEAFKEWDVIGIFIYRDLREVWRSWRSEKAYLRKKSRMAIFKNMSAGLFWSTVAFIVRYRKDLFVRFSQLRQEPESIIGDLNAKLRLDIPVDGRRIPLRNTPHEVAGNPSK